MNTRQQDIAGDIELSGLIKNSTNYIKSIFKAREGQTDEAVHCAYCGEILKLKPSKSDLDRLQNLEQYKEKNLVFSCGKCNTQKGKMNAIDFL